MKTLPPSRTAEQFLIRLPEGVRDRIADLAKANGRSMNAELVDRIQRSLETTSTDVLMEELAEIKSMVREAIDRTTSRSKKVTAKK